MQVFYKVQNINVFYYSIFAFKINVSGENTLEVANLMKSLNFYCDISNICYALI